MIKDIVEQEQQLLIGGHQLHSPPSGTGEGQGASFVLPSVVGIENSEGPKEDMPDAALKARVLS